MSDKLVYDLSQELEGSPSVFVKRDWLNILDNQNGSYSSNQSVIDTSQLSNSNKYMSYREAYLLVPLIISMGTTAPAAANLFTPATAATSADYSLGLKNWYGSIIHSITLDYNGTTIIQQTPFCNMWNSFKLMTSLSLDDVNTQGSTIGFYPDDADTWTFKLTASTSGIGVCNNTTYRATGIGITTVGADNVYRAGAGNVGFVTRQTYINFDTDGLIGGAGVSYETNVMTEAVAQQLYQSYIFNKVNQTAAVNGIFQIAINAQIYLKHIHSFFMMCPLLKGVFMKITLNLNNTTSVFSTVVATEVITLVSVQNAVGGVNPLMVASASGNSGGDGVYGTNTMRANVSVGGTCLDSVLASTVGIATSPYRNIFLYVPSYTFNPIFEQSYLSSPIKQIKYTDIYQYQISAIPATTGAINNLLTNGIASIKSVLVLPFYSATSGNLLPCPEYQSPFDPAGTGPTAPMVQLTNFNVVVSGQNMLYNTQRYSFEQFSNQLYGTNAVNGGMTDGITSSLINFQAFKQCYCYYYVDVSRMLPVEESVPKSVQIIGTNTSSKAIDLWCFIEYGVDVSIDVLTGARV